jgi:hypothetical protein
MTNPGLEPVTFQSLNQRNNHCTTPACIVTLQRVLEDGRVCSHLVHVSWPKAGEGTVDLEWWATSAGNHSSHHSHGGLERITCTRSTMEAVLSLPLPTHTHTHCCHSFLLPSTPLQWIKITAMSFEKLFYLYLNPILQPCTSSIHHTTTPTHTHTHTHTHPPHTHTPHIHARTQTQTHTHTHTHTQTHTPTQSQVSHWEPISITNSRWETFGHCVIISCGNQRPTPTARNIIIIPLLKGQWPSEWMCVYYEVWVWVVCIGGVCVCIFAQ